MKPVNEKRNDEQCTNYNPSTLTFVSRLGVLLLMLLLARPSYAQPAIGADVDESGIQVTYHVKTDGYDSNDSNAGTSEATAFRTVGHALYRAKDGSLNEGKKTKVFVHDGTYISGNIWLASDWSATARETVLVIEGESADGVILEGQGQYEILSIQQKDNLVIRKLTFKNGNANGGLWIGVYHPFPINRQRHILIDRCKFKNNIATGAQIQGIDNLTMKDCVFENNGGRGMDYVGRYSKFQNLTFTNNTGDAFHFGGTYCLVENTTITDNDKFGFRMDHVAEHVTIKNSTFSNNGEAGMIFETCVGPVLIEDCEIADNEDRGIILVTAHGVTINRCALRNNNGTQLAINPQDRTEYIEVGNGWEAGNFDLEDWLGKKPIAWVENTILTNSSLCVTSSNADSYLIKRDDETNADEYKRWFEEEFSGSSNTYYHAGRDEPFDISEEYYNRTYTTLSGWQSATGEDDNSVWSSSCGQDAATGIAFNGYYKIVAKHSGKALDVESASTANEANVFQHDYNGGSNQQWKVESVGDGYYKIISKHSNRALDVAGVSLENGGNIYQYEYLGGDNQQWRVESVGDGYYKIIAKHSNKALDVDDLSQENGANVQQWDYTGSDNQKWQIIQVSSSGRLATEEIGVAPVTAVLAPNPTARHTTFRYRAKQAGKIRVTITDMLGRVIANKIYQVQAGESTFQLDLDRATPGVHLVTATGLGAPVQLRLTISR